MAEAQEPLRTDDLPEPVVTQRRVNAALIWLVPALAALVGLVLVVGHWLQAGPTITISFLSADGLVAGKTPVKYKSVVIGKVTSIVLSRDHGHVLVKVALDKTAEGFATADARYWVVRPRIGLGGVSGVDTLFSGAFIGADVGRSKATKEEFDGLETPPAVLHDAPGKSFTLHSEDLGSLDIGSPVYYRRIPVGQVASYQLDPDGNGVTLQIFVGGPNDKFVTRSTRFWNASGVDVSLGAAGLKINSQSLATVLAGGVAFEDPPGPHDARPAPGNASFTLFADEATALAPPDGPPRYIRMRFDQPLRGLAVGAPVEFLGIDIGKVVSLNLEYDAKERRFPLEVGAVIYAQRLGHAYRDLADAAIAGKEHAGAASVIGVLVARGLRAQARIGNLITGQIYIALDFVPNAPQVSFDVAAKPLEIPTAPGSLDKLQEQLADVMGKLRKIPFDRIGANLDRTLAELDQTLKQVNGRSLPQLNGALEQFNGKTLPQLNSALEQFNGKTLPQINSTLEGAQRTLRGADRALSADSPLQQNLAATLEQLQRTARSLRALTDYLGAHPEALIRGRQPDQAPQPPQQGTRP